jgi:ankyrin repeat protein
MNTRLLAGCMATVALSVAAISGAGKSEVADATMQGNKVALRALLQRKVDVNLPQPDGATALHWAVYRDDTEAADLLIRAGAAVDVANREGTTPLAMACLYGNVTMVNKLLQAGADAKRLGPNGETMLMLAARNGQPETIYLLVRAGAQINAKERLRGTTALMWAAEQKHPAAVKALLESGADYSAKTGPAGLPRNYLAQRVNTAAVQAAAKRYAAAAAAGRTYAEQLAFEAQQGRDLGGQPGRNSTLPGAAPAGAAAPPAAGAPAGQSAPATPDAQAATGRAAGGDQAAAIRGGGGRGRGQAGAGRGAAGQAGQPAGGAAAGAGEDEDDSEVVVAGLVGTGGGGLTALTLAAREGDAESANLLLAAGADVNQPTEYGWTPLLTAANNRHYKLASMLIDWGADVNLPNKGGWTPLYLATDNRNIEGGDYPVQKPDMDHLEFIRILLDHGADPNARAKENTLTRTIFTMQWFFEDGCTPFVRASQSSDTPLMKLLLQYGADPKIATNYGDTALTAAAGIGWVEGVTYERSAKENFEAVKMLLDLGLDPNGGNKDGRTPLMGAALKGRGDVIQLLVEHGAKLDQRDYGSRDSDKIGSALAGHTWLPVDYADGLVRVGVQSAVNRPETASLIRKMMYEQGFPACESIDPKKPAAERPKTCVPPANRVVESICVVELCKERTWQ